MATSRDSGKFLGLSQAEQRVLLYSILCPTYDGRNPVSFEKLASELGYAVGSAKVMYGSARRKLIKATGVDPGRKPYSRSAASASSGAVQGSTNASAGFATSDPSTAADEGEALKTPRKVRRLTAPPKRKADEMDAGDNDGNVDEDEGAPAAGEATAEA